MKKHILLFIAVLLAILAHGQKLSQIKDVTATAAEVNRLAGVTGNVQTQLNAKLDTSAVVDYGTYVYTKTQVDSVAARRRGTTAFLQLYGSAVKTTTVIASPASTNSATLIDNTLLLYALEKQPWPLICTEARWFQYTAGNYTADNENRIGLYKLVGTTYTLVASIPDDANLWVATSNTEVIKTFTAPYTSAANEQLYLGFLYNNSAQTTAPLLQGVNSGNTEWFNTDFMGTTNYLVAQKSGVNTLPASFDSSTTSRANTIPLALIF